MKKISIAINILLSIISICLIGIIITKKSQIINEENTWTSNDYVLDEYDCTFTKTYKVVNLLDGYIAEVPEWSYVVLDQFQNHKVFSAKIPSNLKVKLKENEYYEFTYTIKGNGTIKTMEDINNYLILDNDISSSNNDKLIVTLTVKETDKQGIEQVEEDIYLPK